MEFRPKVSLPPGPQVLAPFLAATPVPSPTSLYRFYHFQPDRSINRMLFGPGRCPGCLASLLVVRGPPRDVRQPESGFGPTTRIPLNVERFTNLVEGWLRQEMGIISAGIR